MNWTNNIFSASIGIKICGCCIFTKKRKKKTDKVGARQAEIEQAWDKKVVVNYDKAKALAEQAMDML